MYEYFKEGGYVIYPVKLTKVDSFGIGNIGEIYEEDSALMKNFLEEYNDK